MSFLFFFSFFFFSFFFYWIISPWSSLVSNRERRRRNRAIENSSASVRQRRWPRAESIWTTFSLARWPCNCPVASAGTPQSSLYRIPLSTISLSSTRSAPIFLYRRSQATRSFRALSARRFSSSRSRAKKIRCVRLIVSVLHAYCKIEYAKSIHYVRREEASFNEITFICTERHSSWCIYRAFY